MRKKKIVVSSKSGFCFGVKRALDMAEAALKKWGTVYSLGPIIHNPQVVGEFSKAGLKVIKGTREIKSSVAAILVPSHGINPGALKNKRGFTYIDTTCPFVARVQRIVGELKKRGYFIIIVGNRAHPEVKGLKGMAGENSRVVRDKKEARALKLKPKKVAVISQTTAPVSNFRDVLSEIAKKDFSELISYNTVCRNIIDRQKEAECIARSVDSMIIIGGRQSANTAKLAQASREINKNTCHVESAADLKTNFLKGKKKIGIATGASTPPYAIEEVLEIIKKEGR